MPTGTFGGISHKRPKCEYRVSIRQCYRTKWRHMVATVSLPLDAAGHRAGPMFRRVRRGAVVGGERIADRSLRRIIVRRAADAGVEGRISGHSLRVGAAQSLAAAGASVVDMQTAGRWKSPEMPGRYARGLAPRLAFQGRSEMSARGQAWAVQGAAFRVHGRPSRRVGVRTPDLDREPIP